MTSLLAISALYIVIFGNIPLLGYLTTMDSFVVSMFVLLCVCIVAHQVTSVLSKKVDKRPLQVMAVRMIEYTGRVLTFPLSLIIFGVFFCTPLGMSSSFITAVACVVGAVMVVISVSDIYGMRKAYRDAVDLVQIKQEQVLAGDRADGDDSTLRLTFVEKKLLKAMNLKVKKPKKPKKDVIKDGLLDGDVELVGDSDDESD